MDLKPLLYDQEVQFETSNLLILNNSHTICMSDKLQSGSQKMDKTGFLLHPFHDNGITKFSKTKYLPLFL